MTNNIKHVALRTCIATGEKKDKKDLIRLVKLVSGEVIIDLKGKGKGRGANIIPTVEAFDMAIGKGAIERALKLNKKFSKDERDNLRKNFLEAINERLLRNGSKKVSYRISKEEFDKIKAK